MGHRCIGDTVRDANRQSHLVSITGLQIAIERVNKEIKRRTDVVGILPARNALIRLVGAVLAEQHDEWAESRRFLGLEILSKSRVTTDTPPEQEATTAELTA
ncbi:hypothetical protein A4G27_11305 [Mycobacterium kansasii]|nr:hypothetical protein A4G27_11305 [Mycobacterium kansasii]